MLTKTPLNHHWTFGFLMEILKQNVDKNRLLINVKKLETKDKIAEIFLLESCELYERKYLFFVPY